MQEFVELNFMCWLEISVKDCINVREVFEIMVYKFCESYEQYLLFELEYSGLGSFIFYGVYGVL